MKEEQIISLFRSSVLPSAWPPGQTEYWKQNFEPERHLKDDCALLPASKEKVLITTDSMAEDVHFRLDWSSPEDIALKLIHINLSDLICGGGDPAWCMLNLGFPENISADFIQRFASAFNCELEKLSIILAGGDTFRSSKINLNLTLAGPCIKPLRREGKPGNGVFVSGDLGMSYAGYLSLSGKLKLPPGLKEAAEKRHRRPEARLAWGKQLRMQSVYGAMDISDGIFTDVSRMAAAADLDIDINLNALPHESGLLNYLSPQEIASGGEDFEILFLADPDTEFSFPCTMIGRSKTKIEGTGMAHFFENGKEVPASQGFEHFHDY